MMSVTQYGHYTCLNKVVDANGLECDERISKLSEEKLREILEEVRKLRRKKKRMEEEEKEVVYVR